MMLASSEQSRAEDRETVMLRAKVVDSRGTRDARISDVSSRGLLGNMEQPPERGEFINIHFPAREVAGQVRWVNGRKFGVRLRERVDAASLTSGRRARQAAKPIAVEAEEEMSLRGTLVAYAVMGLTALSTAYLIVTYVIF
jgi:hypothetical protein